MRSSGNQPDGPDPEKCVPRPLDIGWAPSDFERWARLIADGEVPLPDGLSSDDADELTARVRTRRRDRLLKIIAELIAGDIARDHSKLGKSHDQVCF